MLRAFGQRIIEACRRSGAALRYFCARPEGGNFPLRKTGRKRRAEFEFLELRTFFSAGWDITLIDSTVSNQAILRRALVPGGRVILYNGKTDTAADVLTRVTDWAQETGSTIKSISLLSEGAPGRFELGNQWISNSTLLQTAPDWKRLSRVLANDAVIKLYGCDLADPLGAGQRLIDRVASVTGAEVFATTNLIGRSGDWAFDAAVKQLNPLQSSSLAAFPTTATSLGSSAGALDVSRVSVNRASLAITPGGAKTANTIKPPAADQVTSGVASYSTPQPRAIHAPAVGTIAGWTNRVEPTENVVLLDTQIPDATALEKAVLPGTNLITYDGATATADDVLAKVIDWAQTSGVRIGSLSLLSHGNTGAFELGDQWISSTALAQTAMEWRRLGDVLAPNASIDIFGCDVAAPGGDGQFLIDKVAKLTGGDVFASTNLTGKGGDWNLEAGSDGGEISSASPASFPLNAAVAESYPDSLLIALSTAAAASPSPVTGTTTSLSVTGLDLLGTSSLTYTWSTTGTPPAPVTFSANGTTTSDDVTATFTKAGTYDFTVSMVDGSDTASSSVSVTVNQTATSIVVSPATAALNEKQTQQFSATEFDQFGDAMATQPTFTWADASGVGSISSSGLYTAPHASGSASITATSGSLHGSAAVTVTNATPTVATAASASPNPVTGTTTALSVLGADDGGESNLTYTWTVASGPSSTVFGSDNRDNSAKNITATFSAAGTYTLEVTIADGQGGSVTSPVPVTVQQTLTGINLSPSSSTVSENGTQQFSATAVDQFGNAMSTQPAITWSMNSGSGSINANGLFAAGGSPGSSSVKAISGSVVGTALISVVNSPPTVATAAAASPNPVTGTSTALSVQGADDGGTSQLTYTWQTTNTAPAPVTFSANGSNAANDTTASFTKAGTYNFTVTITDGGGLTTSSSVSVVVRQKLTTIAVSPANAPLNENQTQQFAASGFDQFGLAMSSQPSFSWSKASGVGSINADGLYTAPNGTGSAAIVATNGSVSGSASITVVNAAPTVATPAAANPSPVVTGNATELSVLGADDGGESHLTYTWTTTGDPPASVDFTDNGTNTARYTVAIFSEPGTYHFRVTITDAGGLSTTSTVTVLVDSTLANIVVSPDFSSLNENQIQQFTAEAYDQFGNALATQPAITWSENFGVGSIDGSGLYTASSESGVASISASSGSVSGQAWVSVTNATPTVATAAAATPNPVTGTATALSVLGADDGGESNLTYSWSVLTKPSGASAPSFSVNGSNSSKDTVATFSHAGTYHLEATITDAGGLSTTSTVSVTVDQTFTSIGLSPANSSLAAGGTQQFSAAALDQFGLSMAQQPSFSWASNDGVISSTGIYTAAPIAEAVNISATSGSISGSTTVTIVGSNTAGASPSTVTGNSTTLSVSGGATSGVTYTWSIVSEPHGAASPTFSVNGSGAAQATNATFLAAGNYTFQVAIDAGSTTTQRVDVTVDQTLSSVQVSPAASTLNENGRQTFDAVGFDQFGRALLIQPGFSWDVSSGGGTIDGNGVYTAAGSNGAGSATIAAVDGNISGSANITVTNAAPTIASAATASPVAVSATTSLLSVQGADDGGESNLTYTWSSVGQAPAPVNFSSNGSNAARNTTATFTEAGDYQFQVTITDAEGLSTTSSVQLAVNQTLTTLIASPPSATVAESQSEQFAATATDQFGNSMPDPSLLWSVRSGTGYIDSTGLFTAANTSGITTISASCGSVQASAAITVPNEAPTVATAAKATPSLVTGTITALSVLGADDGGESNLTYTWSSIGSSPAAVVFSANGTNAAKNTIAHFTRMGDYELLVTITDAQGLSTTSNASVTVSQTLTQLTVSPASSTVAKGATEQLTATATDQFGHPMTAPSLTWSVRNGIGTVDSTGLFTAGTVPGSVAVAPSSGNISDVATIMIPNEPPTIAIAASASSNPVGGTSTMLSVLGADDGGEANLTYTWTTISTPPGAVSFSANGTNRSKDTTATFTSIGNYQLLVTITDAQGATVTSSANVVVAPVLAGINVTSAGASVGRGQTVQFGATAVDQFGTVLTSQPTFSWSTHVGSVDVSGLYTAPMAGNGTATVIATSDGQRGNASIGLENDLSVTAPSSANATPGTPFIFDQDNAISISDGDPRTANVPVSITISATQGTLSLSETSGLTFTSGTGTDTALATFSGTLGDVDNALHGMSYAANTGFAGLGSVMVAINEVGNGKQTPSRPVAIDVAAAAVATPSGSSASTSSSTASPSNVFTMTPTLPAPTETTTTSTTAPPTTDVSPEASSGGVDGTSSSGGSAAHATPAATPAKQGDAAPKASPQPANTSATPAPVAPAAAMPNLAAAVPDVRVESVPDQVFPFFSAKSEMSKELDTATNKIVSEKKVKIVAGSATVASFGASAAYVLWMLRGGSLLSSLLSILPAWQSIDPLPVLDNFESRKRRKARMISDGESLESMVDKSNSNAEKEASVQEQP